MIAPLLLLCLAALMAAAGARLPAAGLPSALPFAPPFALPAVAWRWLPPLLAAVAAALAWRELRRPPPAERPARARATAQLLFFPALFAWIWGLLGDGRWRAADAAGLAVAGAAAAALLARGRRDAGGIGFAPAALRPALRALAWPTLIMVLVPLVWGLAAGVRPPARNVAWSLLGYPLYALVQLLVCCALPLPRLRRLGATPTAAAAGVAALFALAHWPNGVLMLACLLAMFVWATVYQRRPSVPALALSMGLAATAFTQALPPQVSRHARVGPRYVRQQVLAARASAPAAAPTDTADVAAFMRALYPDLVGRPAADAEARAWADAAAVRLRERIAWQFLTSDERRARRPDAVPPPTRPWWRVPPPWRDEIARLGSPAYRRTAGGDDAAFLAALYREVLAREASATEVAEWRPALAPNRLQREALVAALYDACRGLARGPVDSLALAALRLP